MYPNQMPNMNLPPGWQMTVDSMGRYYFVNPHTGQQSWTPPVGANMTTQPTSSPSLVNSTSSGLPLNLNVNTPSTSSRSSLPEGWEEATDAQGRVYYIDHINKKTSWIHPSFSVIQPSNPISTNNVPSTSTSIPLTGTSPSNKPDGSYPSIGSEYMGYPGSSGSGSSGSSSSPIPKNIPLHDTGSSGVKEYQRPRNTSAPSKPISTTPPISTISTPVKPKPATQSSSTTLLSHSAPLWDLEKLVPSCSNCYQPFTVIKRRHHCRCCQREFCDPCTLKRTKLPQFNHNDPVRVCEYCYNHQSQDEKTCISRLIPYLFENYRDPNQQYQALLEIYDYIVSYDANAVEKALVGGLKPFLEYVVRIYKEPYQSEAVSLACQIMEVVAENNEKMLKTITESKEQMLQLFDIMIHCKQNQNIQTDIGKILKSVVKSIIKNKINFSSPIPSTSTTTTNTGISSLLSLGTTNNPTNTTNATNTANTSELLVPKNTLSNFLSSMDDISPATSTKSSSSAASTKNKEDLIIQYLKIISQLLKDEKLKSELLSQNLIGSITPLLLLPRLEIIKKVFKILIYLIENDNKIEEKFFSTGGLLFISELVIKETNNDVNDLLLKLLLQLSKSVTNQYLNSLVENGLLYNLILKFNDSPNQFPMVLQLVSAILERFPTHMAMINSFANNTIVQSIVSGCQSKNEIYSFKIIEVISANEQIRDLLIQNNLTDVLLLNLMEKSKSPNLALSILSNLAKKSEKVCQSIFEIGGLSMIVEILSTPPPKSNITTSTPTPATTSTSTGGLLSPLSKVPYHDEPTPVPTTTPINNSSDKLIEYRSMQLNCIKLLRTLSTFKNICKEFVLVENGKGIILLVQLLNPSNSDSIKEIVSETLANLCEDEATSIVVLGEGGLQYTQALLSSNQVNIKNNALKLIQKLAIHSPDIKFAISEGTSIQKMVELLQNSNLDIKKSAIYSLSEICRENESNRDLAYKYGALNLLLACFNTFTRDIKILVCILEILAGFSQQDKYKQQLLSSDLIQSIIEYLFSSLSMTGKEGEEGFIIQSQIYSVLILSKLVTSAEHIRKVLDTGLVLSLTPLLSIKNSYLQEYTLNIFKTIYSSVTADHREMMLSNGILQSLSDLLVSKNDSILSNTLYLLTELSKSQDCGGYLLSTNAINIISDMVVSNQTKESIKSQCIQLISTLFETSSNQSNIWEIYTQKAGIPGIIALLLLNNSLSISAANAISSIVVDGPGRARIIESGGLQTLLAVLSKPVSTMDPLLYVYCLIAVYGLSMEDEICVGIVNLGGVDILLKALNTNIQNLSLQPPVDYKLYVLETIVNLVSNAQCKSIISANEDFISQIVSLLFIDQYKWPSCKILSMIPLEGKSAETVALNGGSFALIFLLQDTGSLSTQDSSAMKLLAMKSINTLVKSYPNSINEILTVESPIPNSDQKEKGLTLLLKNLSNPSNSLQLKVLILEFLEFSLQDQNNISLFDNSIEQFIEILNLISKESTDNSTLSIEEKKAQSNSQFTIIFKILIIISQLSKKNPKINNHLLTSGFLSSSLLSLLVLPPVKLINDEPIENGVSLLDMNTSTPASVNPKSEIDLSTNFKEELKEYQDTINKLILEMIYSLSLNEKGKNIIRNMKCIDSVIRFLDDLKHPDLVVLSLDILSSLSINSINRLEIYTSNAFDKIFDLFDKSTKNHQLLLASLSCIHQLLFLDQIHQDFVKRDFYKPIANALSQPNETIQYQTIKIINRHLNQSKFIELLVEKHNIIIHFVNILNNASSENLILFLLRTLNDFLPFDQARQSIHDNIPIEILKTLQNVPNLTLRELSSNILETFNL